MAIKALQKAVGPVQGGKRREVARIEAMARQASPEAIAKLVKLMRNGKSEKIQMEAADKILIRGCGKPGIAENRESTDPSSGEDLTDIVLEAILDS